VLDRKLFIFIWGISFIHYQLTRLPPRYVILQY
jgi:hypothetical protein